MDDTPTHKRCLNKDYDWYIFHVSQYNGHAMQWYTCDDSGVMMNNHNVVIDYHVMISNI